MAPFGLFRQQCQVRDWQIFIILLWDGHSCIARSINPPAPPARQQESSNIVQPSSLHSSNDLSSLPPLLYSLILCLSYYCPTSYLFSFPSQPCHSHSPVCWPQREHVALLFFPTILPSGHTRQALLTSTSNRRWHL